MLQHNGVILGRLLAEICEAQSLRLLLTHLSEMKRLLLEVLFLGLEGVDFLVLLQLVLLRGHFFLQLQQLSRHIVHVVLHR